MNEDPTRRFSRRVEYYVKYRPGYPEAVLTCLQRECGLTKTAVIADIGSGTGLLTRLFLQHGNPVYAIEPNDEMRRASEQFLAKFPNVTIVNGRAEATTLPDQSVDFITAGQAFHWFDHKAARQEFQRILRPGGFVVLVWNSRHEGASPFMQALEAFNRHYGQNYQRVREPGRRKDALAAFFNGRFQVREFSNEQIFDFEGLKGRKLSASYIPLPDHPDYPAMIENLKQIFDRYQENGFVRFQYITRLFYGQLSPVPS